MQLLRCFFVVAAFSWVSLAQAQGPDKSGKTEDPPAEQAEVRFTDDSVVRMSILQERLEIVTKYGKLAIPTADIMKIDFGVHVPAEMEKKIAKAIEDLGSENYKTREMALKDLVNWGPSAYPQVVKATKSDQLEVKKRALLALDKLKAKHPAKNLRLREEDIIVTPSFTVVGKIVTPTLKAKAENFGELDIQLGKLRAIRWLTTAAELEIALDAGKYAMQGQWMATEFEVKQGMKLSITASGQVNLWPQNGGYQSGPRGWGNDGFGGGGGQRAPGLPYSPGTLIGKVGEDGPMFVVGDSYNGSPNREGKLYLHIAPSPWVPNSIGTYNVKVVPKGDFD
ncbi:MAG TPA: hypothetical protein VE988_25925 [Gemmataceae bacterium]|nr:hypothetical protein [Gemmataceae bacterium]